jgi:hypothetical protein
MESRICSPTRKWRHFIGFRQNIIRAGLAPPLRQCLAAGRLILAASGGSMQLTRNVSLFRLVNEPLGAVLLHDGDQYYKCVGRAVRYRQGVATEIRPGA